MKASAEITGHGPLLAVNNVEVIYNHVILAHGVHGAGSFTTETQRAQSS